MGGTSETYQYLTQTYTTGNVLRFLLSRLLVTPGLGGSLVRA